MGFQHMTPEQVAAAHAKSKAVRQAKAKGPKARVLKGPPSIAMQMLDNYRRRLLKGQREGWE
jgi:hypothetical protein